MEHFRPVWAEVDLTALSHNVVLLRRVLTPTGLCVVVKADAYGHGAVPVARAALRAGASGLAVALVEEGLELREAGITAPVLLLSEAPPAAFPALVAASLTPTLYSEAGLEAAIAAARAAGTRLPVHVKLDTGMHRVGVDPDQLLAFAKAVASARELDFEGLWTHFAVADEPEDPFTALQLERFEAGRAALRGAGIQPTLLHAANSAGALSCPASRLDFVRAGIACYGYAPGEAVSTLLSVAAGGESLWPVLSLKAEVHLVRELAAGERPSYGRRYSLGGDHLVATVPLGYADGLPRRYFETGGEVLIGGKRRPLAGSVTMDQIVVDLGKDTAVRAGEEVVLIGRQGDEEITAAEWAGRLGTIAYEVLTGLGPRVPRHYVGDDDEAPN